MLHLRCVQSMDYRSHCVLLLIRIDAKADKEQTHCISLNRLVGDAFYLQIKINDDKMPFSTSQGAFLMLQDVIL